MDEHFRWARLTHDDRVTIERLPHVVDDRLAPFDAAFTTEPARHGLSTSNVAVRRTTRGWLTPLLGLVGLLAGLLLTFAPVWLDTTTVTWPAPGHPAVSSSAVLVPYRPWPPPRGW